MWRWRSDGRLDEVAVCMQTPQTRPSKPHSHPPLLAWEQAGEPDMGTTMACRLERMPELQQQAACSSFT